jgi:hypothetical protein
MKLDKQIEKMIIDQIEIDKEGDRDAATKIL